MLGLLALGFTCLMIFTLVKNALVGKQLSPEDGFHGTMELLIPITAKSEFYIEAWQQRLANFQFAPGQLKIHILIDGHHPSLNAWEELRQKLPYIETHSFPMRPEHTQAIPWMIEQIAPKIQGEVVIIGDAELVPTQFAFLSLSFLVKEKNRPYFALPQTARLNILGETLAALNPTLALASFYGPKPWRRFFSHPLMSIAQGWMAMPLGTFKELDFKTIRIPSWKDAIFRQWQDQGRTFNLAFGEKQLIRYYPEELRTQINQLKIFWGDLWKRPVKTGFWLFVMTLFLWSFPLVCFLTHPFWSLASFVLLVGYRFFSKIVFQESWGAIILHFLGCLILIVTLFWWVVTGLKTLFGQETRLHS